MQNFNEDIIGTVTVDSDRYDALIDSESRCSVLRSFICDILENETKYRLKGDKLYDVEHARMSVKDVCLIMGFQATYEGYRTRLEKALINQEIEKEKKDGE